MAAIYWLGTDRASGTESRSWLDSLLLALLPGLRVLLGEVGLDTANMILRKVAHFCGYALLALLDARCIRSGGGTLTLTRSQWMLAWTAAVGWALVDEIHQGGSPSRTGSPWDVALDSLGAAAGLLLYRAWILRATPHD